MTTCLLLLTEMLGRLKRQCVHSLEHLSVWDFFQLPGMHQLQILPTESSDMTGVQWWTEMGVGHCPHGLLWENTEGPL